MSDFRAVAALTATLRDLLQDAVSSVPGATVRTGRPDHEAHQQAPSGLVNVFLYQAQPNANWRNAELPVRRSDGSLIRKPTLALDLHFLLTFYGDESKLVPELLLGLAAAALHRDPVPSPAFMPRPDSGSDGALDLAGSGLSEQAHLLRFVPLALSHDELSKVWSIFFQVPYAVSLAYRGAVVLIEPDGLPPPRPTLPVTTPVVRAEPAPAPAHIERIEPQILPWAEGARMRLFGRNLGIGEPTVRIGDAEAEPLAATPGSLEFALPAGLAAGVQTARIAQRSASGEISRLSDPIAFVLQPRIVGRPRFLPGSGQSDDPARVVVRVQPAVAAGQEVRLLLNRLLDDGESDPPAGMSLEPETGGDNEIRFAIPEVAAGRYLVRVAVGGAASPLTVDEDPASPSHGRFVAPQVMIEGEGTS